MAAFQQSFLIAVSAALLHAADPPRPDIPRFRPDDPFTTETPTLRVGMLKWRSIDDLYDFLDHSFVTPRRAATVKHQEGFPASRDVNTLGEVPDHSWYTNRHFRRRMSLDELRRGPGNDAPPRGRLVVTGAKTDGITPGFTVRDETGQLYLLKFDPPDHPELASGADMIGSKLMFALGYFTPENYIIRFRPEDLTIAEGASFHATNGQRQRLTSGHIRRLLREQPRDKQGTCRALASRWIAGETIGPFKYSGSRSDDPNDVIPHENRRVLRGLAVFAAWINHTDTRAINSMDSIIESGDHRFIRHHLIDFGSCFGSDSVMPKLASRGNVYDIEPGDMLRQTLSLGLYAPAWQRTRTPRVRGVGRFEAVSFEPRNWKSAYPNPAFLRMSEDDAYWAARQVAAFTDEEIRTLVQTAAYTDPRATAYLTHVLAQRRDKIAAAYVTGKFALDRFRLENSQLAYDDLRAAPGPVSISWAAYDNQTDTSVLWPGANGPAIPREAAALDSGAYFMATLRENTAPETRSIRVYFRREGGRPGIVGVVR